MKQFPLTKEPIDLQLSVHFENLISNYGSVVVFNCYNFICGPSFNYEFAPAIDEMYKKDIAIANLVKHYGKARIDMFIKSFYQVKIHPNKKARSV